MGSGISGSYSGTKGGSHPYADTYSVVKEELNKDKQDPDIYNPDSGYFKNPTAITLQNSIENNSVHIDGKRQDGELTYVMDKSGNIIIGKRFNPNDNRKRSPHPTLIGGKKPKVQCAGIIKFKKGRIFSVNNQSGHFRPNPKSLDKVKEALQKMADKHPEWFSKDSEWRK